MNIVRSQCGFYELRAVAPFHAYPNFAPYLLYVHSHHFSFASSSRPFVRLFERGVLIKALKQVENSYLRLSFFSILLRLKQQSHYTAILLRFHGAQIFLRS